MDEMFNYTAEDFLSNYGLYLQMANIMKKVDGSVKGLCCGKNKKENIDKFINNREKYLNGMKSIKERQIQPKFKGCRLFYGMSNMICADLLTDEEIISICNANPRMKEWFSFPQNEPISSPVEPSNEKVEETTTEENKELTTAEKRRIALAKAREAKKNKQKSE